MKNPGVTIHHNPEQAARSIDAALKWIASRKDKKDDTEYTFQILASLLLEAKAALTNPSPA